MADYIKAGARAGKEYPSCGHDCSVDKCIEMHKKKAKCPDYYKL